MTEDLQEYAVFPEHLSKLATGGPAYETKIQSAKSGLEYRYAAVPAGKVRYNIVGLIKRHDEIAEILSFFRAHRGKERAFLYKDWHDHTMNRQEISSTNPALVKEYKANDTLLEKRPVKHPVKGSVSVYIDGSLIKDGYKVDYKTGLIIISDNQLSPDTKLEVSCEFYTCARFDMDSLEIIPVSKTMSKIKEMRIVEC